MKLSRCSFSLVILIGSLPHAVVLALGGCAQAEQKSETKAASHAEQRLPPSEQPAAPGPESKVVELTVRVVQYKGDMMYSFVVGPGGATYHPDAIDASVCEILSPAAYKGQQLLIWGWNRKSPVDPELCAKGNVVHLRCDLRKRGPAPWKSELSGFGQWEVQLIKPARATDKARSPGGSAPAGAGGGTTPNESRIEIVVDALEKPSPRYSIQGRRLPHKELLDALEARLKAEKKPYQIKLIFQDKRESDDDTALVNGVRRLASRYGASLEIAVPRSSYDGTTKIVLPIEAAKSPRKR